MFPIQFTNQNINATSVTQTNDGGYVLGLFGSFYRSLTVSLIKTNPSGTQLWNDSYYGSLGMAYTATNINSIIPTEEGGFVRGGTYQNPREYLRFLEQDRLVRPTYLEHSFCKFIR